MNTKTIQVEAHHTIQQILETACNKIRLSLKKELDPNDYTFKICGREQYFGHTDVKFNTVIYVRELLKNMQPIILTMVRRSELPLVVPPEKERLERMQQLKQDEIRDTQALDSAPDMYALF